MIEDVRTGKKKKGIRFFLEKKITIKMMNDVPSGKKKGNKVFHKKKSTSK